MPIGPWRPYVHFCDKEPFIKLLCCHKESMNHAGRLMALHSLFLIKESGCCYPSKTRNSSTWLFGSACKLYLLIRTRSILVIIVIITVLLITCHRRLLLLLILARIQIHASKSSSVGPTQTKRSSLSHGNCPEEEGEDDVMRWQKDMIRWLKTVTSFFNFQLLTFQLHWGWNPICIFFVI